MPSFTFDPTIPIGTHYPGNDRPLMQTNFNSTQGILNVDHYSFDNQTNGGWHKQISLPVSNVPSTLPTGAASVIYSDNGSASASGISQLFMKNSAATFILNSVKAFGAFTTTSNSSGNVTALNSYNINTTISVTSSFYAITLNSNVVTGNNVVVVLGTGQSGGSVFPTYAFSNGVLTIRSNTSGVNISFLILQA